MRSAIPRSKPDGLAIAAPYGDDARRWEAVKQRDKKADGFFYYAVSSTGVYCRPWCPARLARRENVSFHSSPESAERAGFRACKRCRPLDTDWKERHARAITAACHILESAEQEPSLQTLARNAGMSRFHFHRVFRELTGVTPKAYAAERRAARVRSSLRGQHSVTRAFHEAGYTTSRRFYETSTAILGMTPTAFRAGGNGAHVCFAVRPCSLGHVLVAATVRGVCAISLGDDPQSLADDLRRQFPLAQITNESGTFEAVVTSVVALIESPANQHSLPLDVRGTSFQRRVWEALRALPAGRTATYSDIAAIVGAPKATRAVAKACASNPVAIAIPCHRIVRRDGQIAGYRWGIERKCTLLAREAAGGTTTPQSQEPPVHPKSHPERRTDPGGKQSRRR